MINLDLLIAALVLLAVALRLGRRWLPAGKPRWLLVLLLLLWSLLPHPWGLASWLLSYVSSFSVTSGLLALVAIQASLGGKLSLPRRQLLVGNLLLVLLALVFYPLALGAGPVDVYGWGYNSSLLLWALLLVGVLAWLTRNYLLCVLLVAAQLAYAGGLLVSDNLWDYLFDPLLVGWAFAWLLRAGYSRCRA